MKTIGEIEVVEPAGIRRFLYPLEARIAYVGSPGLVRVAEESGALVPSATTGDPYGSTVDFAISLAPNETRRLLVVETDEVPDIPDPITISIDANDYVRAIQPRFSHRIDSEGRIESVIYDHVQHLAEPATITLDDQEAIGRMSTPAAAGAGLAGRLTYSGKYMPLDDSVHFTTTYRITSCKSWIDVRHRIENAPAGARVTFTMPMSAAPGATTTCDFGVGNGLYGKLQAGTTERIVWNIEMAAPPKWWVGSCALDSPTVRIDCEGEVSPDSLPGCLWLHWVDRDKALAVAITRLDPACERASIGLSADGTIKLSFFGAGKGAGAAMEYGICWHFLNDIPPIAAATTPASILLPPQVRVV